jgi:multicomponent Na+:H+ antiporter subunit A
MLIAVLSGFIIAFFAPVLHKIFPRHSGVILSVLPFSLFVYFASFIGKIGPDSGVTFLYDWIPSLGINLSFNLDGLSLFFALLISGFGTFVFLYAHGYLHGHYNFGRFYLYLSMFMASMLGLVLSDNLISLFVFWELTSLTSYLLIGYYNDSEKSRKSALQAMLVTVLGGLFMMAGVVLIGMVTGTYRFSELLGSHIDLKEHPYYLAILILIGLGAFTKSAQFPFHFWLPNAMAAPAPVSAYLHSTTMVKAGIYLLARMTPILGSTPEWQGMLTTVGAVTMVMAALLAIQYTDLKKILAYTTISALGVMVFLIGIGTTIAIQAAMIFLLAHALYKGTLFMVAGNIDHETGTRDVSVLSGLRKKMPFTAYAAVLATMSMAGVMPFFGFIAKEILYEAALDFSAGKILVIASVFITGVIFAALAIELGYKIFFGKLSETPKKPHEAPLTMISGPALFATIGLIGGLFAEFMVPVLRPSTEVVLNVEKVLKLSLWHGFNLVLLLSLLTILAGFIVYRLRDKIRKIAKHLEGFYKIGPAAIYDKAIPGLISFATLQTKFFQNGDLKKYISTIMWVFTGLVIFSFFGNHGNFDVFGRLAQFSELRYYDFAIVAMILISLFLVIGANGRLTALIALGVVGYGIAIIFVFYGAPDLAMTQFLIETLTVVLFVLILHRLPNFIRYKGFEGWRYVVLSVVFGLVMTSIVLMVTADPLVSELREAYSELAYPEGKGRNVVNVILVDFRQMDTLGEIAVLAIAALGIFSLLKIKTSGELDS